MIEINTIKTAKGDFIEVTTDGKLDTTPYRSTVYYPLGTVFTIEVDGESKQITPKVPALSDS